MLDVPSILECTMPDMTGIQGAAKFGFTDTDLAVSVDSDLIQRDVKIFKTGTFTDMRGRTRTWDENDLDLAVEHFYLLRDQNIIPHVPVREDHTISIKDVVGYFRSVRRVGQFLYGDWEWSTWDSKMKWEDKKYRNRSIEIGQYVTNDGTKYDPVVLGLAFVDFPAVEGLYRIADHGERDMAQTPEEIAAAVAAAEAEAEAVAAADAQAAADAAAAAEAAEAQAAADAAAAQAATDAAAAADLVGAGAHRGGGQPHVFRMGDADVSDYAQVQAHIVELETFRNETIESGRTAFIDSLVDGKVMTGPQAEKFRKVVQTMTPGQFDDFKDGFEGMAPANLFARHDLGDGGQSEDVDATTDRISVLNGIVSSHRARGASEDDISKMSSFQELQTLTNAKA